MTTYVCPTQGTKRSEEFALNEGYISHNYKWHKNKKYYLSRQYESFNLATMNGRCKQLGGYLVQVDNSFKHQFDSNFVSGQGPYFTGITDEESEGRYYTYNDKTPAKYHHWRWFQRTTGRTRSA
ncbi:hypothetical protein PoB_004311900 [Plakobranchus ocellatus]|uniref:C-type lectin domain-containing protein n=1 Tax=Plakobranchus ocellatus TaxID=259542 RepID=A0AAV4BCV0_9GAST|nr:hypothetical protein PoB_004311900 [Plakobranchus ocellatus]